MSFRSEDLVSVALEAGKANVGTNFLCTRRPDIASALLVAVVGPIRIKS